MTKCWIRKQHQTDVGNIIQLSHSLLSHPKNLIRGVKARRVIMAHVQITKTWLSTHSVTLRPKEIFEMWSSMCMTKYNLISEGEGRRLGPTLCLIKAKLSIGRRTDLIAARPLGKEGAGLTGLLSFFYSCVL